MYISIGIVNLVVLMHCLRTSAAAMDEKTVHFMDAENSKSSAKHGGWLTFPFIIATMAGMSLAAGGWISNLMVYLMEEFNMKSISAAQVFNVVNGCSLIFPIAGAIVADSFLGCFSVVWISALISLLGTLFLVLTAAISKLRPPKCENGSSLCQNPSHLQLAVLYIGLALGSIGLAGTRYTIAPMGANQFDKPKHQGVFINWYIVTMYMATVISSTAIVYVQDNVSWTLGYGISFAANVLGLAIFLSGSKFYRHLKPQGSPFVALARVVVVAARKRKLLLSQNCEDYYQGPPDGEKNAAALPTKYFRFLNRAALKAEGETNPDGSLEKPWELCTVQEVEDFKGLTKMLPLWSTGVFMSIPLVVQLSMTVIQALTMNRKLGTNLKIPASTTPSFILISTSITIIFIDRLIHPLWERIVHGPITPLKRVGIGHLMSILSMAVSALVESRRLKIVHQNHLQDQGNTVVPMSVLWLVPGLALAGIAEGFAFPGNVAFYYQEFPVSLKSTSTAVVAMFIGIAFYLGNALLDLLRKITDWLPDDINKGRLDYVFWACCMVGAFNYAYYLLCASMYRYRTVQKVANDDSPK